MMSKTLGIVFSNMHDSMLGQLTENRTMASVPFGGRALHFLQTLFQSQGCRYHHKEQFPVLDGSCWKW